MQHKKEEEAAFASCDRIAASKQYGDHPIVTEIRPVSAFWPAEECQQQFYEKCDRGHCTSRQIYE